MVSSPVGLTPHLLPCTYGAYMASSDTSRTNQFERVGLSARNDGHCLHHNNSHRVGKSARKARFEPVALLAVAISLVCLALSVCVVTSRLRIAWTLGFNGQIIAIGFLLGIQNLCMAAVVPHGLLLLECRFGKSTLQNYESLLANRVFVPRSSLIWRLVLTTLIALPLGLSVAYKRFAGGSSTALIRDPGFIEVSQNS